MLDRKKNSPNSTMKQHHYHPPAPTNSEVMRRPLKYVTVYPPFLSNLQCRNNSSANLRVAYLNLHLSIRVVDDLVTINSLKTQVSNDSEWMNEVATFVVVRSEWLWMTCLFILFRERLIHLLAVRPYKKPELIIRITRGEWVSPIKE